MSTRIVVDSTALLAFCDPDDIHHDAAHTTLVEHIHNGHPLVIPASVLAEVLAAALRSGPHAQRVVTGLIGELASEVRPIDRQAARAAAGYLAANDRLPLHVALILGTAKAVNAEHILTTDPTWPEFHSRVRVIT
jgi:predicted nucleic acid-binding protein